MTIFNRALFVINEVYADEYVKQHMTPLEVTKALADSGLLTTDPKIIRTREELAALDPQTILTNRELIATIPAEIIWHLECDEDTFLSGDKMLPAVVVATGEQVRAADRALDAADATADDQAEALTSEQRVLPVHRTEAGYPNCSVCDGGGCLDCTDPA